MQDGADCLMIDAESEYEGKYISAQTYMTDLRAKVGANHPLALAGFPYIDYHPGFPYSVFLGPGGAQYNAPQMYWKDIQTTTDAVFAHTYEYNLIYQRPIFPLGQVYAPSSGPPDLPLPPALQGLRCQRRQLVGLAGGDPVGVDRAVTSRGDRCTATSPTRSWPRSRRAPPATWSSGRRST